MFSLARIPLDIFSGLDRLATVHKYARSLDSVRQALMVSEDTVKRKLVSVIAKRWVPVNDAPMLPVNDVPVSDVPTLPRNDVPGNDVPTLPVNDVPGNDVPGNDVPVNDVPPLSYEDRRAKLKELSHRIPNFQANVIDHKRKNNCPCATCGPALRVTTQGQRPIIIFADTNDYWVQMKNRPAYGRIAETELLQYLQTRLAS